MRRALPFAPIAHKLVVTLVGCTIIHKLSSVLTFEYAYQRSRLNRIEDSHFRPSTDAAAISVVSTTANHNCHVFIILHWSVVCYFKQDE
jgi:hypothetical protein